MNTLPNIRPRLVRHALVALVLACLATSGCTTFGTLPPVVNLANLEITDLTAFETSGEVLIRLANENPEPVTIEGASYRLSINGLRVGQALSNEIVEIPALATAVQRAELTLSNIALLTRVQSVLEQRSFDYEIRGKLYVKSSFGTRRMSVESEGFFDFEEAAAAAEPSPASHE